MAQPHADRNLLFGILALQLDFISRDQLVVGMNAWVLDKHKPLGQVLVEQHTLKADTRAALELLVDKHLECHQNQPQCSLAALSVAPDLRQDLNHIADAEVHASLASLPTIAPHGTGEHFAGVSTDLSGAAKAPVAVGEATSSGLRFRVLRPHAEGGLGRVSVARDRELNRDVALKEIKPEYADDAPARARFLCEAEVTGGLEHPGVVPVYGLGRFADGRPFYAMRFVQGDSLKDAIDRFHHTDWNKEGISLRTLALRELLQRFVDVCNAVAYAHSRGVIHRDLKPANVMLGPYGETLLVDWGLAKPLRMEEGQTSPPEGFLLPASGDGIATQAGAVVGTPSYMAPEQASSKKDVGPTADVYALGAILYELLVGRPPFKAATPLDTVLQVLSEEPVAVRRVQPKVPRDLETICHKCLEKDLKKRYGSAEALAEDLRRFCTGEAVAARPVGMVGRATRWARRRPAVAVLLAVVVIVGAMGAGGVLWSYGQAVWQRDRARDEKSRADVKAEEAQQEAEAANRARDVAHQWLGHTEQVQQLRQQTQNAAGWEEMVIQARLLGELDALQKAAGK
jgi:serine/threonine-protein kinase